MTHTTPSIQLLTLEEFFAYDDGTDIRYELVDGLLVEMPPESDENLKYCQTVAARADPTSAV